MIKINKLNVVKEKRKILDIDNMEFPDNGIVSILGPSGCGKTTLLNCLSNLIKYNGEIIINGTIASDFNENEAQLYRILNFGYVYQNYNLYELNTVYENVAFACSAVSLSSEEFINKKVVESLDYVGVLNLKNKKVSDLSGGEKQRVAIARAIVNNPRIILADEPTGALDDNNANSILNLFKEISSSTLVIMVTHNRDLATKYSNKIFEMSDGKIINEITQNRVINKKDKNRLKLVKNNMHTHINHGFLFSYTYRKLKQSRFKSYLSIFLTSLSMLFLGFSVVLSSIISETVKASYGDLVEDQRVVVSLNESSSDILKYSASKEQIDELSTNLKEDIDYVGVCYSSNFEYIFGNKNYLSFQNKEVDYIIPGFGAREINDFKMCGYKLNNDELILGLTFAQTKYICEMLEIHQSIESLKHYLGSNRFDVVYNFANYDWDYEDVEMFNVVDVELSLYPTIFHSNPLWNEYVFEDRMRMPTKDNSSSDYKPWRMHKIHYLSFKGNRDFIMEKIYQNEIYDKYIFEWAGSNYFRHEDALTTTKSLVFFDAYKPLHFSFLKYINEISNNLYSPILGTGNGYAIYPDYLMSGFGKMTFFTNEEEKAIEIGDLYGFLDENEKNNLSGDGVLQGHFSKSATDGVAFIPITGENIKGEAPISYREIVVSSGFANQLFPAGSPIGQKVYIANEINDEEFSINTLTISGIVENKKNVIYHNIYWPILFFKNYLKTSAFDLKINAISYKLYDQNLLSDDKESLEKAFPFITVKDPHKEIVNTADQITNYILIFLVTISVTISIISLFILLQINSLYLFQIQKDIGIARCLGISKKESYKFISSHILFCGLISILLAIIEFSISYLMLSNVLGFEFDFIKFGLNAILPVLSMILLESVICLVTYLYMRKKVRKLNPLECLYK